MRTLFTTLTAATILCGMALMVRAEDADKTKSPGDAKKIDAKAQWIECAKLRIKLHRTMADLIEAQIASEPDKAKIKELSNELDKVRKELYAKRPNRRGGPGMRPGLGCPWGEQGMGPGPGRDGGRGRNMGPGQGYGRPGQGMGPGPRGDRGRGRNMGPGRGNGRQGQGMGPGRGNGRQGQGMGSGRGNGPRRGFGQGRGGPEGRPEVPPGPPPWGSGPDKDED